MPAAARPVLFALLLTSTLAAQQAAGAVTFNRDVRPILADRCFHCHGPDQGHRKAGLRLDRADGPQGAYRTRKGKAAIEPGSLERSALWYRLTTDDLDDRMPPADSHKKPLTAGERDVIRRWVLAGARYQDHWSFVPPAAPEVPQVDEDGWCRQPLDHFVLRRLREEALRPGPPADRRTLIRRVTFDLTGLPPSRDAVRAFVADPRPDSYELLVDDLLARPEYGEHMARYWLDLVRFADTNGVHHDHYRDMSPFRDWVIRAFNDNLRYDAFVTDQLAGDLHPEPTTDQRVASGFNRLHMIIDRGTRLPEESFARNVIDRVTAVGTAFMGLTLGCAVCHDHKYDPIRQKDFYQLYAFFNNLDGDSETGGRRGADFRRGLQPPYIDLPDAAQARQLEGLERQLGAARDAVAKVKEEVEATKTKESGRLKAAQGEVQKLTRARDAVLLDVPAAMVMKERAEPNKAHILVRGAYDHPGAEVQRDTPAFLPPLRAAGERPTRLDLARWMVARDHPLTARVAVNRFWQQLFGVGLVKTAEDFGIQGEWPSHPELLDHLAVTFVESGWDVKALMRRMVLSATYRQASVARPEAFARDPENRLLARGSRFRLDAEVIRDQILAATGRLNRTMFGRSVKPPQPPGVWKAVTLPSSYPRVYEADTGDAIYRRSVYTFWKRAMPPPQMSILNAPTREFCTARRERTNTPLQALLLLNEPQYLDAARHLAAQNLRGKPRSDEERISVLYETITARVPDTSERAILGRALGDLREHYRGAPPLAADLAAGLETSDPAELAAWTMLISTIFNLDITKTRS